MGARLNLRYHVVLVSKYRNRVFEGIEDAVIDAFGVAEKKSSFKLEHIAVEDGDHVHLILRMSGSYALSRTVARVKSITANVLSDSCEEHLKEYYWSGSKKLWGGGYYAATIGDVSTTQVEKYLKKQGYWK